jgi:hypothetical protein
LGIKFQHLKFGGRKHSDPSKSLALLNIKVELSQKWKNRLIFDMQVNMLSLLKKRLQTSSSLVSWI